ncbi:unnamed protein product [Pleuronectes platessa]|uniref:Uncharacterized protein n=1 Tax=Pleuronectes platessa TaxID=8262 RepID=A0A9N7U2W5_PLEPL|nr:unnamed protein product [Pleuronectes platessa]
MHLRNIPVVACVSFADLGTNIQPSSLTRLTAGLQCAPTAFSHSSSCTPPPGYSGCEVTGDDQRTWPLFQTPAPLSAGPARTHAPSPPILDLRSTPTPPALVKPHERRPLAKTFPVSWDAIGKPHGVSQYLTLSGFKVKEVLISVTDLRAVSEPPPPHPPPSKQEQPGISRRSLFIQLLSLALAEVTKPFESLASPPFCPTPTRGRCCCGICLLV